MNALARSTVTPDGSLLAQPGADAFVRFAPDFGCRFLLVIDTEEEFDWSAPFDRAHQQVTALAGMARGQAYFAAAGLRPLYVTDYPVAADPAASAMMGQWLADGTADIGAHLHPWVNPPHAEAVNVANSFAGSLPEALERAKLETLCELHCQSFGKRPIAYRAGRYGIGPNSGRILADLGFRVDSSVRSRFDYSAGHGPDFARMPVRPWRAGPDGAILELPLSTAYVGLAGGLGEVLYPHVDGKALLCGGLSRLGLLRRVPLTPEGVPLDDAIRAVDVLLASGRDLLMFSFHSPSLEPGHTPYTRNPDDLAAFYRWWDGMLDHLARAGVAPVGLDEVLGAVRP